MIWENILKISLLGTYTHDIQDNSYMQHQKDYNQKAETF